MSGMQFIHLIRNGKILTKALTILLVSLIALSGCSPQWWIGSGRGDGRLPVFGGYELTKINSYDIFLTVPYSDPKLSGGKIVIEDFSISEYQLIEPFLLLKGIRAESLAEQQEKMKAKDFLYYLVDTETNCVFEPFVSQEEFLFACKKLALVVEDEWISTKNVAWE